MGLTTTVEPTFEPVTPTEAKDHLRVTGDDENVLISLYLSAARRYAEDYSGRTIPATTYAYTLDCFPTKTYIELPAPPLYSVTSISYIDTNGNSQTWASNQYYVDNKSEPGKVVLVNGATYPLTQTGRPNAVTITYVAGWQTLASIPVNYKLATLQFLAHAYEYRNPVIVGASGSKLMQAGEALIGERFQGF